MPDPTDPGSDPGADPKSQGDPGQDPSTGDLGEGGKKALEAERSARQEAERQLKEALAKVKAHEDEKLSESERQQARLTDSEKKSLALENELQTVRANRHIERAAGKMGFIDPEDAVLALDRTLLKLGEDGVPEAKSLEAALSALATAKPHLLGSRPTGSGDGGARRTSPSGTDMNALIRESAGLSG